MKLLVVTLFVIAGSTLGCATNYFNVPAENFAERVKVIGIAPIFIDEDSDISHPEKELIIPLIAELNRKYEPLLVHKLQSTGNFYAVTLLSDQPQQLFKTLMSRREKRDDAAIQYNKYFWKNDEVGVYIKKNHLDAVMLVVVSGLTKNSKIYGSNILKSVETNFNFLIMTAQIVDPDGMVLWEYPNFRGRLLTYYPLLNLQYPDFSESEANLSDKTNIHFKSLDGIRRTFEQKKSDWLFREAEEPKVYDKLFSEMASLIKHDGTKQLNQAPPVADKKTLTTSEKVNRTVKTPDKPLPVEPVPEIKPTIQEPVSVSVPKTVITPETHIIPPNDVVPATDSTR